MITVNMHDAKTRLSELVKAVEERDEAVVVCRDGRQVAEIRRRVKGRRAVRALTPDPRFQVESAAGYRSAEPLSFEMNVLLDTCALLALARVAGQGSF